MTTKLPRLAVLAKRISMLSLLRSDVVRVKVALKLIPRSTRTTDSAGASAGAGAGVNGADAEVRVFDVPRGKGQTPSIHFVFLLTREH